MTEIVLHQWKMSPFCNKVRRMLAHKNLAYTTVEYNGLLARNAAKLSAQGTLPVIDCDGQQIVDSSAIGRFLDAHFPQKPLWPEDKLHKAQAHFWEDWAGTSLYAYEVYLRMMVDGPLNQALDLICEGRPAWERSVLKLVFKRRYPKKMHSVGLGRLTKDQVEGQLLEHVDHLQALLSSREWLVGDAISIADISVAAQLDEILRTSEIAGALRDREAIMRWLGRIPGG